MPSRGDGVADHRFHEIMVSDVIDETDDCRSLVLDVGADKRAFPSYLAGQFVTVEIDHPSGKFQRCYSLSSAPAVDRLPKITVKRTAGGPVSNWINDNATPGMRLRVQVPSGRFVLRPQDQGDLMLFAGGSGITPIISLIKERLSQHVGRCRLIYANRCRNSVVFGEELMALERTNPERLQVAQRFDGEDGLITADDVYQLCSGSLDDTFFVCGPALFMDTVERGLELLNVDPSNVRSERFTLSSSASNLSKVVNEDDREAVSLRIELGGREYALSLNPGQTILSAAIDAGIDVPFSCMAGICKSCIATVLEGDVHMLEDLALTTEEKQSQSVLTCQSISKSGAPIRIRY